jgi:phage terminase Nu1 subunit (DNA packaging protein)
MKELRHLLDEVKDERVLAYIQAWDMRTQPTSRQGIVVAMLRAKATEEQYDSPAYAQLLQELNKYFPSKY